MSKPEYKNIVACLAALRTDASSELAWRCFYLFFRPRLEVFLLYSGANRSAVEDLCQQVMLKFLTASPWSRQWANLPDPPVILTWLKTTGRHLLIDMHRAGLRQVASLDKWLDAESPSTHEDWPGFENSRVNGLLKSVAPEDQVILTHKLLGYTLRESAESLGISEQAAGTRFHRLKKKLAKLRDSE